MTIEQMTPEDEVKLRLAAGISPSTPTEYMLRHIPLWVKMSILRRNLGATGGGDIPTPKKVTTYDFTTNTYRKNGSKVSLGDVSEFIRLSTATMWQDGKLVDIANNVPRISVDGLLIEKSTTELIPNNSTITSTNTAWAATSNPDTQIGNVFEFVSDGTTSEITSNIPRYPNGNYAPDSGLYYKALLVKKSTGFLTLGSAAAITRVTVDTSTGEVLASGLSVKNVKVTVYDSYFKIELSSDDSTLSSTHRRFTLNASDQSETSQTLRAPSAGHKVAIAYPSFQDTTDFPQSTIKTESSPATRSPNILNIPLPPTPTLSGDWDDGVTYEIADNIATFTGHGYIRNITVEAL